jgi:hypothetical protein
MGKEGLSVSHARSVQGVRAIKLGAAFWWLKVTCFLDKNLGFYQVDPANSLNRHRDKWKMQKCGEENGSAVSLPLCRTGP